MNNNQKQFLDFAIEVDAIRFGEFKLKSGRISPYFFNAGLFDTGNKLASLGKFYARAIVESGIEFDMLFGPSYKGIPIAASTAMALAQEHGHDVPFSFNRKEAKKHAEGGLIVGAKIKGRVLIIDDVISAGISVYEAAEIINDNGGKPCGVAIALDRQEVGSGKNTAVKEVELALGVPVISIVSLELLEFYLKTHENYGAQLSAMAEYREKYGVKS